MATLKIQEANLTGSIQPTANLRGTVYMPEIIRVDSDENTYLLIDEYGNEAVAIFSDETVTLDATPNDIRIGKTAATAKGVTPGEKEIPAYHTKEGTKFVPAGSAFSIFLPKYYDYSKLQAIFCPFNTSLLDSVAAERVAINGSVYPVSSTDVESEITKDITTEEIIFGIINDTSIPYIIRYFTYKEIY